MNKLLPKALTTPLAMAIATALPLFSLQVNAEQAASGFDKNRLHLGAGVSYNHIDMPFGGRSADAAGINLFVGYELSNRMPDVVTTVELGYGQTDDFYADGTDISGLWIAGTIAKDLPEINPNLFAIGRLGLDGGDDDGLIIGAGAGLHLNKYLDLRGEYIKKDASSVLQASLVYNF